jgi:DMSO/TMAO reductase YedYZ molybdopterin-dependent catalytic subunit
VVGGRLVDAPQAYHDVSTMPTNLEQPPGPLANPVFRGPERFRYYSVAPVPRFSRATWRLNVGGLVDRPFTLNYGELYSTPSVFVRADFRCVTGWVVHNVLWRGIQLRSLFDKAGVQPGAKFVSFLSFDGLYRESYTLEQAMSENAIVAFELNQKPLPTEQGAPARIVNPEMFGYKGLKWLREIKLTAKREQGYWEQKGWCNPMIGDGKIDDCT